MAQIFNLKALAFAPLLITACAGPIETRIAIHQPATGIPATVSYSFVEGDTESAPLPLDPAIKSAIASRLTGFSPAPFDQANIIISYGFSDRPAASAIAGRSPAKRKRFLGGCADRIVRLSISLSSRTTGEQLYAASAEETHCRASAEDALPHLAAAILPNDAWPAVASTLKRDGLK